MACKTSVMGNFKKDAAHLETIECTMGRQWKRLNGDPGFPFRSPRWDSRKNCRTESKTEPSTSGHQTRPRVQ